MFHIFWESNLICSLSVAKPERYASGFSLFVFDNLRFSFLDIGFDNNILWERIYLFAIGLNFITLTSILSPICNVAFVSILVRPQFRWCLFK